MRKRYFYGFVGAAFAGMSAVAAEQPATAFQPIGDELGGGAGRPVSGQTAFALPAPNLNASDLRKFAFGNRLFNTNWVIAGSSTESFDGLGPIFNRVSCSGCHVRDGRGRPPEPGEKMESMLVRISIPGVSKDGGPLAHPVYSDQIQDRAIPGVKAEAMIGIDWTEQLGHYADGEAFSLRSPKIRIENAAYGPLGGEILMSPRVAQGMIGLGLLEAIPEQTLLALADPQDQNKDGISGRINWVWDAQVKDKRVGRFGWKANQPSLRQQVAGAAAGDIGITSSLFSSDACTAAQQVCTQQPDGGSPEMSDVFLDKLVLYSSTLAVPNRRKGDDELHLRGERNFHAAGCAACHVPTMQTGAHPMASVANQRIHPFTDLLLHDMGDALADGRPDFEASGREWRTAPLWGIGMIPIVNGHHFLLHDGRARGLAEAILWHGGEAEASREVFRSMSKTDRNSLLAFLNSL